jgi:hypothetical protein
MTLSVRDSEDGSPRQYWAPRPRANRTLRGWNMVSVVLRKGDGDSWGVEEEPFLCLKSGLLGLRVVAYALEEDL